jgi:hypothetical protein
MMARAGEHPVLGLTLALTMWVCAAAQTAQPPEYKPAVDTPVGRRVFADLAAYYAAREAGKYERNMVPYKEMAGRLSSREPAERKAAGDYLFALCLQTAADDRSGRAPRPHGHKLGGGPDDYGAEMRGWMASEISDAAFHGTGEDALEAARWLYKYDTWPEHREAGAEALTRIRTPEADKLFLEMIEKPEGHFGILTLALKQAAERKLGEATDEIRPLCRHYNASVRQAALAAASRLGLKDVGRYDPRTDLGPRIEPWLRTLLTVLPERVPPDAQWRRFTVPARRYSRWATGEPKDMEVCGWLISEDGGDYRVIDWTGRPGTWSRKEAQARPDSLAEFAERIVEIREKFNASQDGEEKARLQERMGVRTFMMSSASTWPGSIPEVLAAAWSLERGDRRTCARLMIPLMKDVSDEQKFLDYLRDKLAVEIDKRMLAKFTARDYGEALRLAKLLAAPYFDGFDHQDRAKGLAATLPQRSEDFKALALVSPQAWQALKKQYGRDRQIEYLAGRLRLINATQCSIPGGIDYSDTQHLPEDGAAGRKKQAESLFFPEGPQAINPYCELLRLNLTGAEMLHLVPYLESPDYILAYDLYRFIPQNPWQLHKVSWVVASILNTVSQQELVDVAILEGQSQEARKQHIDRIRKWCAAHAAATHADHLAQTIREAKEWQDVRMGFWGLLELDEERAVKLIVARCDGEPPRKPDLARLLCLLDRKAYLPRARQWMQDEGEETRFWGALLVLKHAGPKNPEGLDIVLVQLAKEIEGNDALGRDHVSERDPEGLVDAAIEPLAAIDDPRVRKFFSTYCGARPYRDFEPSSNTLQRLFLAGYDSTLDRLLFHLGDTTPRHKGSKEPRSDAWLWWLSCWRYKSPPPYLYDPPEEKRAEAYADLKRWLGTQFRLIKEGKPSEVIKEDLHLPWGEWKMYSSGWVQRM